MTKTATKTKAPVTETKAPETQAPAKKGWRIKKYYVDLEAYEASKEALSKAPNQVKIMMAWYAHIAGSKDLAGQGRELCQDAIDKGGLKTVIEPAVLFAYYRKKMEEFGLRLAD